jgi:hypothetical protein
MVVFCVHEGQVKQMTNLIITSKWFTLASRFGYEDIFKRFQKSWKAFLNQLVLILQRSRKGYKSLWMHLKQRTNAPGCQGLRNEK